MKVTTSKKQTQKLINVPHYVFDFINRFGVNAIYDMIKGSSGDNYYICDMRVDDGDLSEDDALKIQEWSEKQEVETLLKLANGVVCRINAALTHENIFKGV
ncbi:hypothetical protein [Liquorilactobacillus hordei]|uniref:hypothetical protein n=1 Tax=Liquorilactobacillus hordei TaxID=468911 RepID=UPI00070F015F|nr:hypothetical protein [Liquorilactobacillus hordei]QYH51079.1 hypothetical protein G6O70_00525 [Liquorilactobacillus hordei DSM 19519]